jgi:ATP-dependent Lon protease
VDRKQAMKFLGTPRFRYGVAEREDQVGIVTGLAWTEMGGEILTTEATVMPGKGKLIITGKLGEVMQESAQAAMSYVRSRAERFGIDRKVFENYDIHVHLPEGAIPKDGPSAGVTICTALVSALTKVAVRRDVAMTGEITLRGRVLGIGGLKEKTVAALRNRVAHVILPQENARDLDELPAEVKAGIQFHPVRTMDDVLAVALARPVDVRPGDSPASLVTH